MFSFNQNKYKILKMLNDFKGYSIIIENLNLKLETDIKMFYRGALPITVIETRDFNSVMELVNNIPKNIAVNITNDFDIEMGLMARLKTQMEVEESFVLDIEPLKMINNNIQDFNVLIDLLQKTSVSMTNKPQKEMASIIDLMLTVHSNVFFGLAQQMSINENIALDLDLILQAKTKKNIEAIINNVVIGTGLLGLLDLNIGFSILIDLFLSLSASLLTREKIDIKANESFIVNGLSLFHLKLAQNIEYLETINLNWQIKMLRLYYFMLKDFDGLSLITLQGRTLNSMYEEKK